MYVWDKIKYIFLSPLNLFLCNQSPFPSLYCPFAYLFIKHDERPGTQGPWFTSFCFHRAGPKSSWCRALCFQYTKMTFQARRNKNENSIKGKKCSYFSQMSELNKLGSLWWCHSSLCPGPCHFSFSRSIYDINI